MLKQKALKDAFSKRLLDLMNEKDITQKELADGIGTSQQAIQQYIKGAASPKMEMFVEMAEFLEVSCDYLLGRTDTKTVDVEVQAVINRYGLNETSLKELERLAAPKGTISRYPYIHPAQIIIEGEDPQVTDAAELANIDARRLRDEKRAKDGLNALNNLLSWEDAAVVLSRLSEFLAGGGIPLDKHKPIQLTQNGLPLPYELMPDVMHEVVFSMLKEALYKLRSGLWEDEWKKHRRAVNSEKLSASQDNTKSKRSFKVATKKKEAKKSDN